MKKNFIGIDISSATLDICLKQDEELKYFTISNQGKAIASFFKKFAPANAVVAMENTGRYNWPLFEVLGKLDLHVYVLSPLHLKKSMGLVRGKNDKIDALRICRFIEKHQRESVRWKPSSLAISRHKILLTERESRLKMRKQLLSQQQDYKLMTAMTLDKSLLALNKKLVEAINAQIKKIEAEIGKNINGNSELKKQCDLMKSVPGVGKIVSWTVIAKTEGFTTITEPRKMACYCGIVPFDHQSGTSLRTRPRVSMYADKGMKSLLHLAAMSAIRLQNDLSTYYLRKVAEGKNKMSALNAVRNKIIHRIFAVVKNETMYKNSLVLS